MLGMCVLSGTSFDKETTYQGRGTGIRKISKEDTDASKNNKTIIRIVLGVNVSES